MKNIINEKVKPDRSTENRFIEIEFSSVIVSGFFQELIPDQFIISAKLVIDNNG